MTSQVATRIGEAEVREALSRVRDPEIDEPITDLGFVTSVVMTGDDAHVRLRLPTAFCAPNFAYLMVSDAMDAVREIPGIGKVDVVLDDNVDSERINAGVAAGLGFAGTFPDETESELEALRQVFRAKAHLASIERVVAALMRDQALDPEGLAHLRLRALPDTPVARALRNRRADLGLTADLDAYVLVDEHGERWDTGSLAVQLRFAKATRISIDGNAHFCRGMLRTRYPEAAESQIPREQDNLLA